MKWKRDWRKDCCWNGSGKLYEINILFCDELSATNYPATNCPQRIVLRRIVREPTRRLTPESNDYTNPNTNPTRPSQHVIWTGGDHQGGNYRGESYRGEITGGSSPASSTGNMQQWTLFNCFEEPSCLNVWLCCAALYQVNSSVFFLCCPLCLWYSNICLWCATVVPMCILWKSDPLFQIP